jgi:hypothetical protein
MKVLSIGILALVFAATFLVCNTAFGKCEICGDSVININSNQTSDLLFNSSIPMERSFAGFTKQCKNPKLVICGYTKKCGPGCSPSCCFIPKYCWRYDLCGR